MKRIYLLAVAAILVAGFFACKRSNEKFDYVINGANDFVAEVNSVATMPIEIKVLKGVNEEVDLSISGLPQGVTATFNPNTGWPNYNSGIVFNTVGAKLGTYKLQIMAYSRSTYYRTYTFNLNIVPISNCAIDRVGSYLTTENCGNDTFYVDVTKDANIKNRIYIANFGNYSIFPATVYADLDCEGKVMNIPQQTNDSSGLTFTGTGVFNGNIMTINYIVNDGITSDTCVAQFKK